MTGYRRVYQRPLQAQEDQVAYNVDDGEYAKHENGGRSQQNLVICEEALSAKAASTRSSEFGHTKQVQ